MCTTLYYNRIIRLLLFSGGDFTYIYIPFILRGSDQLLLRTVIGSMHLGAYRRDDEPLGFSKPSVPVGWGS